MTLVGFLRARIAEDEEQALALNEAYYAADSEMWAPAVLVNARALLMPDRLLAECQVKRRLIRYNAFMLQAWEDGHAGRESAYPDMTRRERHSARLTLQLLALLYADHPDYDESWRT